MDWVFESEDGDIGEFRMDEPDVALLRCFDCGGELDGVVCHPCNVAWLPKRLFEQRLDG